MIHAGALIRNGVVKTPLESARELGELLSLEMRLKLECFQHTGSFKLRGALSALTQSSSDALVVSASAGNHALGLALAAERLRMRVRLFVPSYTNPAKLARLRSFGSSVDLVEVPGSYDNAEHAARAAADADPDACFVSSYNDPHVIAGQGTVALELLEQWPDLEAVIVPVGGGGLISGVGVLMKAIAPDVIVIGAEPTASDALSRSLKAGAHTAIEPDAHSIAEGLVGNLDVDTVTLPLALECVDEIVLVSERRIAAATAAVYESEALIVEPSAAAALAAIPLSRSLQAVNRVACVLTGRNIDAASHSALLHPAP